MIIKKQYVVQILSIGEWKTIAAFKDKDSAREFIVESDELNKFDHRLAFEVERLDVVEAWYRTE